MNTEWISASIIVAYQDDLQLDDQPVCIMEGNVCVRMFPAEFCQSSIDGRNGGNACSIISMMYLQPAPYLP